MVEKVAQEEETRASSVELSSVVTRNLKNIEMRDIFLKFLTIDSSFVMELCLRDVSEFEEVLENASPLAIELFNSSCFYETFITQTIQTLKWPGSMRAVHFMSNSLMVTQDELQKVVDEKKESDDSTMTKAVTVSVADFSWFAKDNNAFINIAHALNKSNNEAIYVTQFTQHVVDYNWGIYKSKMLKWLFLPYLACLVSNIYYFWYNLDRRGVDVERRQAMLFPRLCFAFLTLAL